MKAKLIKTEENSPHGCQYFLNNSEGFAIGSTDRGWCVRAIKREPLYVLSLKNCQAIERGYDLDELAYEKSWNEDSEKGFINGANAILEILGDKKFSEEDMKLFARNYYREIRENTSNLLWTQLADKCLEEHIESLQQNEWEVEIEMKVIPDFDSRSDQDGAIFTSNKKEVPKLDVDGCLILKRV